MAKKVAGKPRRMGRPRADSPVIGATELERMGNLWLRGWGFSAIAKDLGVDRKTVYKHIRETIEPAWEREQSLSRAADLRRVTLLESLAWKHLETGDTGSLDDLRKAVGRSKKRSAVLEGLIEQAEASSDANVWLATIRWAIEFRAKVGNYYASRDEGQGGEFRRAGQDEKSLAEQAIERLEAALAVKRRQREQEVEG
jgi:predicted transcriptional regulator